MDLTSFQLKRGVNHWQYILTGILGVATKSVFDNFLARNLLHESWGSVNDVVPFGLFDGRLFSSTEGKRFLLLVAVTTLPFIWLGLAMTFNRLRDAGLPPRWTLLFFPRSSMLFFSWCSACIRAPAEKSTWKLALRFNLWRNRTPALLFSPHL